MDNYAIGPIQSTYLGARKVKYRCDKGHEFEDVAPGDGPLEGAIVIGGKLLCARCLQALVGEVSVVQ